MNSSKEALKAYRYVLHVDPGEIYFLCGLFDAYEDFAVLRTTDRKRAIVELIASPFYVDEITALIDSLSSQFRITIVEEGPYDGTSNTD